MSVFRLCHGACIYAAAYEKKKEEKLLETRVRSCGPGNIDNDELNPIVSVKVFPAFVAASWRYKAKIQLSDWLNEITRE